MDYSNISNCNILIVDDCPDIRQVLRVLLEGDGHKITEAANGLVALEKLKEQPHLVILDINMPGKDGFATCIEIRKTSVVPILFLTARNLESDKILGLMAGGDDYISKPFSNGELLAKVKTLLRRSLVYNAPTTLKDSTVIMVGELLVNTYEERVTINNLPIPLTPTEYNILLLLLKSRKKIFSLDSIYENVWGNNRMGVGDNAVMAHIKNLRHKLGDTSREAKYIKTAWGKGYYID